MLTIKKEMTGNVAHVPGMIFLMTLCVRGLQTYIPNLYGVVYPSDPFIFIGETLELYCNVTNATIQENSSSLYFEKLTLNGNFLVDIKHLEILSTKAIRIRIENAQFDNYGKYRCRLPTHRKDIGYQIVKVDYRPSKVLNFTCKVFNCESMNCTWELGVNYKHKKHIVVTLVYTYETPQHHENHGAQQYCLHINQTWCHWPKELYEHGHLYYIKVNVSTVNDNKVLDYNVSEQYNIDTQNHVQPAPVERFKALVINSSCVNLTWDHSKKCGEKFYEAYYKSDNKFKKIPLVDDEVKYNYAVVCQLKAFTSYKFKIVVLPNREANKGFPSKRKVAEAITSEDVPASAPEICSGCFYDVACSQNKSSNNRCIQLIWKELNAFEKRGEITHYKVTTKTKSKCKDFSSFHIPVNEHKHLITTEIYFKEAENGPTEISLTPGTKIGFSEKSSYLIVPLKSESPKPPNDLFVEREKIINGTYHYYISWASLHSSSEMALKYKSVTIVWCHRAQENKCHENASWSELDASNVTYELRQRDQDLLIGISAQIEYDGYTVSSGINWADCIYLRNQVPQVPPANVKISSAHSLLKNSLHIMWENFQCSKDASYVIKYMIKYCPISEDLACSDVEKTENVSNHKNEIILRNLKGNTKYKLHIIAVSAAGFGPPSETFISDVMESASESEMVLITVAVIVFVITIVIVSILSYRCLVRKEKIFQKFGIQQYNLRSKTPSIAAEKTSHKEIVPENLISSIVGRTINKKINLPFFEPRNKSNKNQEIKDEIKSDYIKFALCGQEEQLKEPLIRTKSDSGYNSGEIGSSVRNHELVQVWHVKSDKQPVKTISDKSSTSLWLSILSNSPDTEMVGSSDVNINKLPKLFTQPERSIGNSLNNDNLQFIGTEKNYLHSFHNVPSTCTLSSDKHSLPCKVSPKDKYIKLTSCILFQNQHNCQHDANCNFAIAKAEPDHHSLVETYLGNSSGDSQQSSLIISDSYLESDISITTSEHSLHDYNTSLFETCSDISFEDSYQDTPVLSYSDLTSDYSYAPNHFYT